nr:MAG TPA: hypothetical protein [Bacteriophage sp.]
MTTGRGTQRDMEGANQGSRPSVSEAGRVGRGRALE